MDPKLIFAKCQKWVKCGVFWVNKKLVCNLIRNRNIIHGLNLTLAHVSDLSHSNQRHANLLLKKTSATTCLLTAFSSVERDAYLECLKFLFFSRTPCGNTCGIFLTWRYQNKMMKQNHYGFFCDSFQQYQINNSAVINIIILFIYFDICAFGTSFYSKWIT